MNLEGQGPLNSNHSGGDQSGPETGGQRLRRIISGQTLPKPAQESAAGGSEARPLTPAELALRNIQEAMIRRGEQPVITVIHYDGHARGEGEGVE
jgi:hypothetical protein